MTDLFSKTLWIWTGEKETDEGSAKQTLFRKILFVNIIPEHAFIKVSADTRYRLYINGKSVAYGPCKGDGQVWYYEEIDIAPYLHTGKNIIAAIVLRLSTINMGNHSIWRTPYPGFFMNGYIQTDTTWKWKRNENIQYVPEDGVLVFLDIFEKAIGNKSLFGWLSNDYNDSSWKQAKQYNILDIRKTSSPGNLFPRPIPQMYEKETNFEKISNIRKSTHDINQWRGLIQGTPLILEPNSIHDIEIDARELTTGFLQLAIAGGNESEFNILTSECYSYELDKTINVPYPSKGDRTDVDKGILVGFTDEYKVSGFGNEGNPEIYEPFWFRTFRYVKLTIKTGSEHLTFLKFNYKETGYPLDVKTYVKTSDESLNSIWDISLRSLKRCMHETYEDCPFYEQLSYAMDTRSQILFTYSISADDKMARRTIDDFHRSLRYDGLTLACYPSMVPNVIISFPLYYILIIHDHMKYFGDRDFIEKYLPTIDAILAFFNRNKNNRGLVGKTGGNVGHDIYWSFIDWSPAWDKTGGVPDAFLQGEITMESLLYINALTAASEILLFMNNTAKAFEYNQRADELKIAVNTHCIGANGLYQDGPGVDKYSQHCQIWAILTDVAPKNKWQSLITETLSNSSLAQSTVAMSFYLFRAVEKSGVYYKTQGLWEPWREMVKNNLTTCQESTISPRSDCHAWGALALYELPAVILGVTPAKPNYEAVYVRPTVGYLNWAKGEVCTPKGNVYVEWKRKEDGTIDLKVNAPENIDVIY